VYYLLFDNYFLKIILLLFILYITPEEIGSGGNISDLNKKWLLHSKSLAIQYSLIILPFDAIYFELLLAPLKTQNK
jgi:hypothetical protein